MEETNIIYHYTSFEKLQCILKYGTLRFKESTSSNDAMDTLGFVNVLKEMPHFKSPTEMAELMNFIIGYYQRYSYRFSAISLVACFSMIPDSRLLWDAYTMHRPGNQKCSYGEEKYCYDSSAKYDGVCLAFRKDMLSKILSKEVGVSCDNSSLRPIEYGTAKSKSYINDWLKDAVSYSMQLSKDEDQSQNIIAPIAITRSKEISLKKSLVYPVIDFLKKVDAYSPFLKHEFWKEEAEVRALLQVNNGNLSKYNISEYDDGIRYYDMEITEDCIDHIILGPEFDSNSFEEIEQHTDYKFKFKDFKLKESLGKGIIRNQ